MLFRSHCKKPNLHFGFDRRLNTRKKVTHKGQKIKKKKQENKKQKKKKRHGSLLIFNLTESKSIPIISLKVTFYLLHMHVNIKI